MSSLAIAPILQAIRTIIKNHTPDNAKKLADLAGLTLKTPLPIQQHEVIEHTTQKGKVIRGVVRTDLTKDQAKEIDPYTFAKGSGWFIREKHLGGVQAQEPVNQQAEVTPVANAQGDTLVSDKDNGIDTLIAKFKPASTEIGRATKRMDAKDGAKLLKQTLTTNFPDTKFSVVMSRGTGYGSVDVRWTDGASYDLVEVILNHFEGKTFDGMQDMAVYKNAVDEKGNPVDYGLGYVSGHRQYSKSFLEKFLASLPENLKDLVAQHGVGVGGSDDEAYFTNNHEYWVRTRLGDALSSISTGRYSGSARSKVQSQPEEDNSHLSLTWEKDPTRKIWRSNDGKIITDESSVVGGKKTAFFAVYQDQEEREYGNNYATGESLADAKVKAEQTPQPVTSDKLQQLIDGIKAHGAALGGYDNFKVQYQNLDWNPYKNKIKDIARDLKLAGYPKLGGFKQLFNDYVGSVNVTDLPMVEPIKPIADTVITPIQDVQATPPVEAPELAGKDGYMPHDGWRNNRLKARKYAMALGLSLDGGILMPVEDIVAKIDAFNLLPTAEREARLLAITGTAEERAQALSIINAVLDENPTGEFKALHDKALNEIKEKIGKPIHQIYKDYDEFDKVFANVKEQAFLAYASRLPVAIGMGSISSSLASDAHRNTSFSPERRGRSEQISFVADMVGLWQQFDRQYNAANEETQARFKEAFASIKSKAAGLKGATLSAASRTASTMITGGSGFNVSRNQKANQVAHNRAEDYLDYLQNKAPNILRKVIRGVIDDSISGQIVDMQKRIDVAKNNQDMMKKANAVIRKNANKSDDEQIAALVEAGFKEDFAKKIIFIPANMSMYGKGFPSFSLTNNNANIKRMEEQLITYKARQATAEAVQDSDEEIEIAGVKVELNAQDNRIRLFFDGKPDSDTIAALKGSAFKWSPSNSAWQRQMTGNAIRAAETILNDLAERTGQEKGTLPKVKNDFNSINHHLDFVENSHGSINFGEITAQQAVIIGRQAGKIRLPIGEHRANGTGYGLIHIEAKHQAQIHGAGFTSVEKFIESVVGSFEQIWKATVGQLALMAIDKYKHVVFIQLAPAIDGDYYQINTAFPVSRDYFEKKEKNGWNLLWDRSEPISKVTGQQPSAYAAKPDNKSSQVSPIANGQSNDILADNQKAGKPKDNFDDIGGFTFTPAVDFDQTLKAIKAVLANHAPENVKRLAMLTGLTLKKAEPDIELDMFGDPIQNNGFDLFGEPIQDGDDSPVEELPRLAIQELPLAKLTLSDDVPQFKSGVEDSDTGVVEALGGKFDRTGVAPIQVWERTDGRLEIISGRHRTDLARRSGEKTIPAQVHKESEGFTAKQAMMLDAELNIRDGQGKVKDYVDYFSHSEISEEEADKRGLLARSIGQRAFIIASKGSEELLTLHRNDIISDQAAADIANIAPNNSAMQAVGLRVLQEHKPLNNALNTIRAVMALTREKGQEPDTFDLFGFDDSALKEAEAMAKVASRKQRQIAEQLTAIKGAVKNPKLAAKHGVIVENEADALAKVKTMTIEKSRWDNWSSHADLLAEVRKELNTKLDAVFDDEDDYYWLCQEELDLIAA